MMEQLVMEERFLRYYLNKPILHRPVVSRHATFVMSTCENPTPTLTNLNVSWTSALDLPPNLPEVLTGKQRYHKVQHLGKGTYGVVSLCLDKLNNNNKVAVKKIKMGSNNHGVPFSALREIRILQEIHHTSIIPLLDVYQHNHNLFLVFPFMASDLVKHLQSKSSMLSPADIKAYLQMLLKGIEFLHSHWILHRDLKPGNLLLSETGELFIGDFGFSRNYGSPSDNLTHGAVTRWYRAPEMLYGARHYGGAIDVWSVGCILYEMLTKEALFQGTSEMDQLKKIFAIVGCPSEENWPGVTSLPQYHPPDQTFARLAPRGLQSILPPGTAPQTIDLLTSLLILDPSKRITATQALAHPYFSETPLPTPIAYLPKIVSSINIPLSMNPNPNPNVIPLSQQHSLHQHGSRSPSTAFIIHGRHGVGHLTPCISQQLATPPSTISQYQAFYNKGEERPQICRMIGTESPPPSMDPQFRSKGLFDDVED